MSINRNAIMYEGARVLKELFNIPYQMRMIEKYDTEEDLVVLSVGHTHENKKIMIEFRGTKMYGTDLMMIDIAFSVDQAMQITKKGDAFRIFSTVVNEIKKFDKKYGHRIKMITFTSKHK